MTTGLEKFVCPIPGCNCDIEWRQSQSCACGWSEQEHDPSEHQPAAVSGIRPAAPFRKADCQCCYIIDEVDLKTILRKTWPIGHANDCTCSQCRIAAMGGGR